MKRITRIKMMLALVSLGLLISGITVWPVLWELEIILEMIKSTVGEYNSFYTFLSDVKNGLELIECKFSFLLYGYDWLAFAHIVLAILFVGAIKDPVRNIWIVQCGLIMCALVPVLAVICIPIRGIPSFWIIVDFLFAPGAAIPLWIALRDIQYIEKNSHKV